MRIEARFTKYQDAFDTLVRLKTNGFKESFIPADPYFLSQNGRIDVPGSGNAGTLSSLVGNSGDDSDFFPSPFRAVGPAISGLGGFEEITEDNYTLIVDAGDDGRDTVCDLIQSAGGKLH
jgi:hypothetical protein